MRLELWYAREKPVPLRLSLFLHGHHVLFYTSSNELNLDESISLVRPAVGHRGGQHELEWVLLGNKCL